MFHPILKNILDEGIIEKKNNGTYKVERIITSPQSSQININNKKEPLLNFCSNNYLGLSNHPEIISASKLAMDKYGFGMSSVRFICGTQNIHKELENKISQFLQTEDTILFNSCFDANGGLFQNLLSEGDVIISASLNHASIIDGIRLSRAKKIVYRYDDMNDLSKQLIESKNYRIKVVITDGVFSMEGELAPLDKIVSLCEKHQALLIVDDSHATGFIGENGQGTPEYFSVQNKIDLYTSTLGKALGGAIGGYISGHRSIIDWFRNTSRPYLFSNSLSPSLVAGAIKSIDIITSQEGNQLRKNLISNTNYFRNKMKKNGFQIKEGIHPIVPIMLGDEKISIQMASDLLSEGIYVIGFSYPVVPKNEARIRVQISAIHTKYQIDLAINAFVKIGKNYGIIK